MSKQKFIIPTTFCCSWLTVFGRLCIYTVSLPVNQVTFSVKSVYFHPVFELPLLSITLMLICWSWGQFWVSFYVPELLLVPHHIVLNFYTCFWDIWVWFGEFLLCPLRSVQSAVISMSVCRLSMGLCVCLAVCSHMSKATHPNLT